MASTLTSAVQVQVQAQVQIRIHNYGIKLLNVRSLHGVERCSGLPFLASPPANRVTVIDWSRLMYAAEPLTFHRFCCDNFKQS
jgi:hypothetical protein